MSSSTSVDLLWLEAAGPSSAAGQHLKGTLQRLEAGNVRVGKVIASLSSEDGREGALARSMRLSSLLARAILAARSSRCLVVRWHPLVLPAVLAWRLCGASVVLLVQGNIADMHSAHSWTRFVPGMHALTKYSLALGHVIVVPTSGINDWICDEVGVRGKPTCVLPNGFDEEALERGANSLSQDDWNMISEVGPYCVFVGTFAKWQGIDVLVDALRDEAWPAELGIVFVGAGAEEHLVQSVLSERVRWVGLVPPEVAAAYTAGAMVALAPRRSGPASDRGVSPYKVLEAAAAGTPVVATDVRGQAELVRELESGILIPPDESSTLAGAVAALASDPGLRDEISQRAKRNASKYAWRARSNVLVNAISVAVGRDGRRRQGSQAQP